MKKCKRVDYFNALNKIGYYLDGNDIVENEQHSTVGRVTNDVDDRSILTGVRVHENRTRKHGIVATVYDKISFQ